MMHRQSVLIALLSLGLLFSACGKQQDARRTPVRSDMSSETPDSIAESPNEKTPTTVDSLEVGISTGGTLETSITGSGTILTGDAKSSHRLIIFSDYDCAYCRQFMASDLLWIEDLASKGALSIERVFVPMSISGEHAARLALCAAEQQRFPEADRWLSTHAITVIDSEKFSKSVGLRWKTLVTCMANKNILTGNLQKAKDDRIERVPSFVFGSDSWLGLLPKEELRGRIETALKK